MKKLIPCLTLIFLYTTANAQTCQVTASASPMVVCYGNPVTVSATAFAGYPTNQFFNFNQSLLPTGWSTTGGTNYGANTCGQSPDGTPYFWASTVTNGLPQIVTADFDICSGGNLQFQMRYAVQGGSVPCEGPDLAHEGVSIEYSLNSGATWIEFRYYRPDGVVLPANPMTSNSVATGQTSLTTWATYTVPIPPAAISTSTRFRWIQKVSSGTCCDNWGLDNIGVLAGPCLFTDLVWSNGMSSIGNFTFTPTSDTCFTASLYDDNNNFLCSDDVCIQVMPNFVSSTSATICAGQTYYFGPSTSALLPYTTSGSYPVNFTTVSGCDSLVTLHLAVTPPSYDTLHATICNGASYTLGSFSYNTSGTYSSQLSTAAGCDSIVMLYLTVSPAITNSINEEICDGDIYTLGTQSLTAPGVYQEVFTAIDGCDSTVTLDLVVHPIYSQVKDTSFCDGFVYYFGGQNFTSGGSYPLLFNTIHGCDSLITLNITILPAPVPDAGPDRILCSGEVGSLGGAAIANATYSWSGTNGLSTPNAALTLISISSLVPQQITYVVTSDYLGCVATDTVDVAIVPYPVVNIGSVAPQCYDGNLFNFTPGNSFLPGAIFSWNIPQSNVGAAISQNVNGVHYFSAGNHQVTVAVSHAHCITRDTLDVEVYAEPNASFTPIPSAGCIPLSVHFQNTSTPSTVTSQWNLGNGATSTLSSPTNVYTQSGTYNVSLIVTSPEGCVDTVIYNSLINAYPLPVAGFSANPLTVFQDNGNVTVNDNAVGANSWQYTVSSGGYYNTPGFNHSFYDTGYHLIHQIVTNQYGCTAEAQQEIRVLPATTIYIPNAFTPNADNINSGFGAYGNVVRDFRMTIFDRWGMKIFESRDINHFWDGTLNGRPIKEDTYVYKIYYVDHRGDSHEVLGHVTVVR